MYEYEIVRKEKRQFDTFEEALTDMTTTFKSYRKRNDVRILSTITNTDNGKRQTFRYVDGKYKALEEAFEGDYTYNENFSGKDLI